MTLELPADSPVLSMPWIITFGPLSDDEVWEPVVCGPYERRHALALAEEVVADEQLMAVVEPLVPHVSVDKIREEIETAKATATEAEESGDLVFEPEDEVEEESDEEETEPLGPPTPEEIRAGFARIAAQLTAEPED